MEALALAAWGPRPRRVARVPSSAHRSLAQPSAAMRSIWLAQLSLWIRGAEPGSRPEIDQEGRVQGLRQPGVGRAKDGQAPHGSFFSRSLLLPNRTYGHTEATFQLYAFRPGN